MAIPRSAIITTMFASLLFLLTACSGGDGNGGVALNPDTEVLAFEKDGSALTSITIEENTTVQARLVINGMSEKANSYIFEVDSDNHGLIPPENVKITGTGKFRDIKIIPVKNQTGVAKLTGRATSDELGVYIETNLKVIVEKANIAPAANAGPDQSVDESTLVTLDGSGSSDSDGSIMAYNWKQAAGTTVTLSDSTAVNPTFASPDLNDNETLRFTLSVTDDLGKTSIDSVDILVYFSLPASNPVNDTGVTTCGDYAFTDTGTDYDVVGANPHNNDVDCAEANATQNTDGYEIANGYSIIRAGQDAHFGRDTTHNNNSDGHAGFNFTKLDSAGNDLAASALNWSCVKDNFTGMVWEVKTTDGGLHDKNDTYNWYSSDNANNGGSVGYDDADGNTCYGYNVSVNASYCNTEAYISRVNTVGLCGANDWRLPNREEFHSIINYSQVDPVLITDYFPNTITGYFWYWTSSVSAKNNNTAWLIRYDGGDNPGIKDNSNYIRLVRGGK